MTISGNEPFPEPFTAKFYQRAHADIFSSNENLSHSDRDQNQADADERRVLLGRERHADEDDAEGEQGEGGGHAAMNCARFGGYANANSSRDTQIVFHAIGG